MSLISVIIPIKDEEENIPSLYQRLHSLSLGIQHNFEFIFVDDGSTDRSYSILRDMALRDRRVKVIKFSRNFGSHAGCMAGLLFSNGDACVFISADMQEPPEVIKSFIEHWEKGYEVVIGCREDGSVNNIFSSVYYFFVKNYALGNIPTKGTDFFLIDKKVRNAISSMEEKNTSVFGLILWCGFRQIFLPYKREKRSKGASKWTLGKKIKLFIDTFVSFSFFPIRMMSVMGIAVAFIGFVYAVIIIFNRFFLAHAIEGWSSLMVALLLVSGIQMLMLGMLGEYLWRNYDESRHRPSFIVSETTGIEDEGQKIA
jgi:dolichol-phosphate mannosyltransferase